MCDLDQKLECPCCEGKGERAFQCVACGGSGEVRRDAHEVDDACYALWEGSWCSPSPRRPAAPERCQVCAGRGYRWEPCRTCAGSGLLPRAEAEEILLQQEAARRHLAQNAQRHAVAEAELRARALRVWEQEMKRLQAEEAQQAPAGWRGWLLEFFTRSGVQPGRQSTAGQEAPRS